MKPNGSAEFPTRCFKLHPRWERRDSRLAALSPGKGLHNNGALVMRLCHY
jgi:hypothetical protein